MRSKNSGASMVVLRGVVPELKPACMGSYTMMEGGREVAFRALKPVDITLVVVFCAKRCLFFFAAARPDALAQSLSL